MKKYYYLYAHIRPDKGEIFYVGIGSSRKRNSYDRAYNKDCKKHNNLWCKILTKNKGHREVVILGNFDTLKECQEAEIYYIKKFGKICNNTGILSNIADGGEYCTRPGKTIAQYELTGKYIASYERLVETPYCFKAVFQAIKFKGSSNGFQWRYTDSKDDIEPYIDPRNTKVYQLTREKVVVGVFDSIGEASRLTKTDRYSINNVMLGKRATAGGFIWSKTPKEAKEMGFSINRLNK